MLTANIIYYFTTNVKKKTCFERNLILYYNIFFFAIKYLNKTHI